MISQTKLFLSFIFPTELSKKSSSASNDGLFRLRPVRRHSEEESGRQPSLPLRPPGYLSLHRLQSWICRLFQPSDDHFRRATSTRRISSASARHRSTAAPTMSRKRTKARRSRTNGSIRRVIFPDGHLSGQRGHRQLQSGEPRAEESLPAHARLPERAAQRKKVRQLSPFVQFLSPNHHPQDPLCASAILN